MTRLFRLTPAFRLSVKTFLVLFVVVLAQPVVRQAAAQSSAVVKINRTIDLDEIGDARVTLEIKAPTNMYTQLKTETPNIAVLLRQLGAGQSWAELEDVDGRFDDNTSTVVINYIERGLARTSEDDTWYVPLLGGEEMDLITVHDNQAIFTQSSNTDLGLTTVLLKINTPQASRELHIEHGPERFVYELSPSLHVAGAHDLRFECDVKPYLMAALAKSYGNARFTNLWTARSVLKNTGGEVLTDYRVRFRIVDHGSWSSWKRCENVLPGQTVVDPFFPVLDVDKVAKMTGSRPAMLEVEYEYRRVDGELVEESDSRRIQMLSRNQVVFSSLAGGEAVGFHDNFDYAPAVLASMVTSEDPVMQQLAGAVSGMAGGVAAAANDEHALKYLEALYAFMSNNGIAYQTPPGFLMQGANGQHIKYGRDVLRNRAGTCVDLAVLYASGCEAVGLRPVLVIIPGHCFPACYLPSGQLVAVESTMIGKADFGQAVETGMKEMSDARQNVAYFVDIQECRAEGLYCLDLPEVPVNFLEQLGYQTVASDNRRQEVQVVNYVEQDERRPADVAHPAALVGRWEFNGNVEGLGLNLIAVFTENGQYGGYAKQTRNGRWEVTRSSGTWKVEDGKLVVRSEHGTFIRDFKFEDGTLWVYFQELDYTLGFELVQ
ncbi:MAG: hypothetical protein RIC55_33655 [Pirellulaceae bacterium]